MKVKAIDGLSDDIVDILGAQGIEELYPPQTEAVDNGIVDAENLVASVPTASGKTLMASLAMLASIDRGGKALYIVPLRALASEKRDEFAAFEGAGMEVGISTGSYESTDDWLASRDIIVATSEKVDSLIRNGASWLDQLTCVVADEVHLVNDGHRGPTLEVTLAKLRQLHPDMQVVALSATIGNAEEIAAWLDAALVDSTWRPIELRRGVHYGNAVHFADGSISELPVGESEDQPDAVVRDTLEDGGSTLVFVNSRRNAEAAARQLARVTKRHLGSDEVAELEALADDIRSVSDTDTSEDLATVVAGGAAFHHAGLTGEHRSLVEKGFRDRLIRVVSATPTLAAGVNTPSRRVLVRDWRRYDGDAGGMVPLSTLEVQQMFGRAGRPGLDPYGEALLLASNHEELDELMERYVRADPEPVQSKLAAEPALRTHVLSTVADGFATTREELLTFLLDTLYATQTTSTAHLESVADRVIEYLTVNEFMTSSEGSLRATGRGHTVSRLYVDPMSAAELVDGLEHAVEESTSLALYHLVARTPDMYDLYLRSGDRKRYTEMVYERGEELLGTAPSEFEDAAFEDWLSALKTACLLEEWANERSEDELTDRYSIGPGDIRRKVETAEWLLHAAERLAVEENLDGVDAIARARRRVEHGVGAELLDLVEVRGVGRVRARQLYEAGIEDRTELRETNPRRVLRALKGRRRTTETILENVGHPEPDLDDVDAVEVEAEVEARADGEEDQSSLGDF